MERHPLASKVGWIKLGLGLLIVAVGVITSFQITVNKTTVVQPASAAIANPAAAPAIKRSWITEAQCRGIKKGDKISDLDDRFKSDPDHGLAWSFPLAEDQRRECNVYDWNDNEVEHVTLDLVV